MNREIQKNDWDWVAGETSVMSLPEETRTAMKGLLHHPRPADLKVTPQEPSPTEVNALPLAFDWRYSRGGNYLTPVRNQGNCGSCWAFATTAAFESYWERKLRRPNANPNFAEQALVSCAPDQNGCSGGYFTSMKYFVRTPLNGAPGTVREGNYQYVARDTACKSLVGMTRFKVLSTDFWSYVGGGSEWTIPSVAALKSAIYRNGPVAAGVYADGYFDAYNGGIFGSRPSTNAYYTNHAILIYGWGTKNGKTFWKAKNSWGVNWGENGHFRIWAGKNRIGEGAAFFSPP